MVSFARCFHSETRSFSFAPFSLSRPAVAWTNLHISSIVRVPHSRAFIVPKSPDTGWHLPNQRSPWISCTRRTRRGKRRARTGVSGAGLRGITHKVSGRTGKASVGGGRSTDTHVPFHLIAFKFSISLLSLFPIPFKVPKTLFSCSRFAHGKNNFTQTCFSRIQG